MSFRCLESVDGCLKLHISDDGSRNGGPEAEIALMFAFVMSFIWQDFVKIFLSLGQWVAVAKSILKKKGYSVNYARQRCEEVLMPVI